MNSHCSWVSSFAFSALPPYGASRDKQADSVNDKSASPFKILSSCDGSATPEADIAVAGD